MTTLFTILLALFLIASDIFNDYVVSDTNKYNFGFIVGVTALSLINSLFPNNSMTLKDFGILFGTYVVFGIVRGILEVFHKNRSL